MISTSKQDYYETLLYSDGTGRETKRSTRAWDAQASVWKAWETSYFVYSSVLGQLVSEVTAAGKKKSTYVIGAGAVIARQFFDTAGTTEYVDWKHTDPSGLSTRGFQPEELDGLGNNVGLRGAFIRPERYQPTTSPNEGITFDDMTIGDCQLDGIVVPCSMLSRMREALQIERRYHDGSRFVTERFDLDFNLPDRRIGAVYLNGASGKYWRLDRDTGLLRHSWPRCGSNGSHRDYEHLRTCRRRLSWHERQRIHLAMEFPGI